MIRAKVNAKNVPVRRLAGLVVSGEPREMELSEKQFEQLAKDNYIVIVKLEASAAGGDDAVVFGKKISEYTVDDVETLRAKMKGKGNTKDGKLAKELIKKLEASAAGGDE